MARRGSNKSKGLAYRVAKTRERNMVRRITRHLEGHPNDQQSKDALADVSKFLKAS